MSKIDENILIREDDIAFLDAIVKRFGNEPGSVLSLLKAIQDHYHYLPGQVLEYLCTIASVTPQQIMGVATFYTQFRRRPAGRHRIRVCIGTACHVKGAEQVLTAFLSHLHIPEGQDTDEKKIFTVEQAACLGCCMLAPAVQIDNTIYGHLTAKKIPSVISDFLSSLTGQGKTTQPLDTHNGKEYRGEIRLCTCSSCAAAGARTLYACFRDEIKRNKLNVALLEVGCTGLSFEAPLVEVVLPASRADNRTDSRVYRYGRVETAQVKYILDHHFPRGKLIRQITSGIYSLFEKIYTDEETYPVTRYALDFSRGTGSLYLGKQVHIATEYCGELGVVDIDAYTRHGGFSALKKCMEELKDPEQIISILKQSGLRGRGGGGFPVYKKWQNVLYEEQSPRYIICNGDEGDPGAFMDRMLLESFPFRIIEGMLIAGFTLGIHEGILYIRSEYPLAIDRINQAISLCAEHGITGEHVLKSNFSFSLKVVEGAGAFVCGEETALIESIQGNRGMPHFRPPYPSEKGLYGQPTLIQNVETLACIPWIIRQGPGAFSRLGTAGSGGTKTFALAGKIERGGLIEVPMGITLREIVEEIGGGIQGGTGKEGEKRLKAILIGGPSGGCIPEHLFDIPVDFDVLEEKGGMMGSGGMVVLDTTDCMVEIARYFMAFTQNESCGKCTYCRIGTQRMLHILTRLTRGKGKKGDIEELEHLSLLVKQRSLCGLGKTAPNPVISALTYFREEYKAHIQGICPAKKCKALITYRITDTCIGCTICAQGCPVSAITSVPYEKHIIDSSLCIRCDACRQHCPQQAISIT
ncbi:MAG: NAD(P)H-dependent oxidoreductase subunit E [Spirochaetales bacterium]|nr:NAD(P)H-dependent oxidoreductase subunit E [Spirochaetales bacterium]